MTDLPDSFSHHFTLLRHGESIGNAEGVYQGSGEYDLTESGRVQSQAVAEFWDKKGLKFHTIISSPQSRARQTAEIIANILSIPIEFDPNWREIDNGRLAGLTAEQAEAQVPFPEFMSPFDPIGESGESNWDLYLRAGRVVQDLIKRPAGNYLIVSHGGFLNRVLYTMLGILPQVNFSGARFYFRNTTFAAISYDPLRHIWLLQQFQNYSP
ncbi:MAG: histidine phosphatase family protein [Chloroflexota bacterium]|nr:MAG: histidine phosphatase family protein [Chloroflexota bacterium]